MPELWGEMDLDSSLQTENTARKVLRALSFLVQMTSVSIVSKENVTQGGGAITH